MTYSFYQLDKGRMVFFLDATLLKNFAHCERYFYLHSVKNYRPKGFALAKPFPMAIGGWWSDVMESFYNFMRDGKEVTKDDVQVFAIEAWVKNELDKGAAANPDQYGTFGDLAGAVLMLLEYHDRQYLIDRSNWKVISVEQGFGLQKEVLLGESPRVVVYWIGKPDLVVVENSRLTPVDHKTVSRIDGSTTNRYKPDVQMPGYILSCEVIAKSLGFDVRVDRCVVNICSRTRPSDNPRNGKKRPRFVRATPNYNREELEEWKHRIVNKAERIAHCLRTGEWNWSETSCDNFYMRPCDYKKLDSVSPSVRDVILAADFMEGKPWVPYQISHEKNEED